MRRRMLVNVACAAVLPLAWATPAMAANSQDINDDTGQSEEEVESELWGQAASATEVTNAYDNLMSLIAMSDGLRDQVARLRVAAQAARHTPGRDDDRRVARELKDLRSRLKMSIAVEATAKRHWDDVIDQTLGRVEAQHFVTQTTPSGGPKGDGTYAGKVSHRNPFGDVQVTITVAGGKITDCSASYPTASSSGAINKGAVPQLCSEALTAQSATIASVGGASYTSPAFKESLADAIARAGL